MLENYLIIHKSILPEYYEKVLEVRRMMESGKKKDVSQCVREVGISRSTYYKYKDYILEPMALSGGRKAVLSMMLTHEPGVLSALLSCISQSGGSVLTITQSLPIHGRASVTISLDVTELASDFSNLLQMMEKIPGVEQTKLLAIE
ncbi:MAG: ACT domain-containing protein [Oscillospiraceae bacterium]|nr:ACT domain-containing protein [Oscillospiraceae bacterium]